MYISLKKPQKMNKQRKNIVIIETKYYIHKKPHQLSTVNMFVE